MPNRHGSAVWGLLCAATAVVLSGCSVIGPSTIQQGRTNYNEAIHETSEQQTLLNIVRVHNGETPLFMDVGDILSGTSATISSTGTQMGLGSLMAVGSNLIGNATGQIAGTGSYTEGPTIKYTPLVGQALISQVSSPIDAYSLANLFNSGWAIGSIFDLAVTRFTPGYDDYHAALDALMELDRYGTLILEARSYTELVIYFERERPRERFRGCDPEAGSVSVTTVVDNLWARVLAILGQKGTTISLRLASQAPKLSASGTPKTTEAATPQRPGPPPLLRTRSALGMLNTITAGDNLVLFGDKALVDNIIVSNVSEQDSSCHVSFYYTGISDKLLQNRSATGHSNERFTWFSGATKALLTPAEYNLERSFGNERRLILIQITAFPPSEAYAPVFYKDRWYSVQDRDTISKRNLALVTQIDTIQAEPTAPTPLLTTVNVGPK